MIFMPSAVRHSFHVTTAVEWTVVANARGEQVEPGAWEFEPTRPLASALVENVEGLSVVPFGETLFAFAAVLLVSSMFLSLAGFTAKQSMRKYGVRP